MGRKNNPINIEGADVFKQARLFSDSQVREYSVDVWPLIYRKDAAKLEALILKQEEIKGLDFEFEKDRITIIGVASENEVASCRYEHRHGLMVQEMMGKGVRFVGHSVVGAEKAILERNGILTDLRSWEDSMISHYLVNMHLTKAPGKVESDDPGSLGFMGLGTVSALTTNHPQYKRCRGSYCEGPCPKHDPFGYNAMDAWDSLAGFKSHKVEMFKYNIPHKLYREWLELTDYCYRMEVQGINVSRDKARAFDEDLTARRNALFPENFPFNPGSSDQVLGWFKERGIALASNEKAVIKAALNQHVEASGHTNFEDIVDPSESLDALFRLFVWKDSGKGLKPWFKDEYFGSDGLLHPRTVSVGASTARLSCVSPNMMNVAARGWGSVVREFVIPRSEDADWTKADKGQLELRQCITPDTKILKTDATWVDAKDIRIGDELLAFDENQNQGFSGVRYRRSSVVAAGIVKKKTITMTTTHGSITGAEDHFLVVLRKSKKGVLTRTWVEMKDIKKGDLLPFTEEPWETDTSREAGYLAGFADGEGWISKCGIGLAQSEGVVLDKVLELLAVRGFTTSKWEVKAIPRYTKKHFKAIITAGMWKCLKFLGTVRPERLLKKSAVVWENRRAWGGINTTRAEVLTLKEGPVTELCAITTTTKTYIANGFFSHNCLYLAGQDPREIGDDAFTWLVNQAQEPFYEAAKMAFPRDYEINPADAARNSAKITSHLSDYMGGVTLLDPKELETSSIRRLLDFGALRVYTRKHKPGLKKDWTYKGYVVGFNGIRLAEELFKARDWESRRKALQIQEDIFFKRFSIIREWQQKILDDAQDRGYLRSPVGTIYRLYGSPQDQVKVIPAWYGQGVSALHMHGLMLKAYRNNQIATIQVHDELDFDLPSWWKDSTIKDFYNSIMMGDDGRLPNFVCPISVYRGKCWKENKKGAINPEWLRKL